MMWQEAAAQVSKQRNSPRLLELCADENPDHDEWRARVIEMAGGPAIERTPRPTSYPPMAEQIGNALKAGLRFLASGCKIVDQGEHDRRLSICRAPCFFWDRDLGRCRACGCVDDLKAWIATQECPKGYWKETEEPK
jgi:Family of unknown function (DUF6171)